MSDRFICVHGDKHKPEACPMALPSWKAMTPKQEDETFECVECFCLKKDHATEEDQKRTGRYDCGWDLRCEEFDYYEAYPDRYEAMRQRWPGFEFHRWDYETWIREHS